MSSIHYFQRYSQPENVATNNTLLLLSRLYQHSPNKFKGFLNELLEDTDLEAGILFNQQSHGRGILEDYDLELIEIINDYESYCIYDNLITNYEYRMRAVPCG